MKPLRHPAERAAIRTLLWAERGVFFIIGILLFAAAVVLLLRSIPLLLDLARGDAFSTIAVGTKFLDLVLLVLMVVELAYTVILSLRGAVLSAEPFLIVGLIAVIRRILVITVGEAKSGPAGSTGLTGQANIELSILTGVVLVFVTSIAILRSRKRNEPVDHIDEV